MRLTSEGCVAEVMVRLTGTARAIRGSTLIAGLGQQPVLEAFVDAPAGTVPAAVVFELALANLDGDGGALQTHAVTQATLDDAGTHYDYPWTTTSALEGLYLARATATLGDAGYESNPIDVRVDRTAPVVKLTLDFDIDAGVQPRDFGGAATVVATDDGGSGDVEIQLSAEGVVWAEPGLGPALAQSTWVDLPVELPTVVGPTTFLQTRVSGGAVPYDAWSTQADGWKIIVAATATDLAGNARTEDLEVPVTRQLWLGVEAGSSGPISLGHQGQVFVNHGVTLDSLLPDGELQSSTKLVAVNGGFLEAMNRPATMVSPQTPTGQTFVGSSSKGLFSAYRQISSVGSFGSHFQTLSSAGGEPMAFGLSAGRSAIYVVPDDCEITSIDALSGATGASAQEAYGQACSGAQLAVGKDALIVTSPMISLVSALPSLAQDFVQPQPSPTPGFSPTFLGGLSVFQEGSALLIFDPDHSDALQVIDLTAPLPANVVTSSQGDIYSLATNGVLSKMDDRGTQVWTRKLGLGSKVTGLVVGKGGLVYAVDGSGQISAYDSAGGFHWRSPAAFAEGDLMIDRCTGHAYAGTASAPVALVLDSPGVDASPGSWPMGGHDVFQTYDSQGTADVDCSTHL